MPTKRKPVPAAKEQSLKGCLFVQLASAAGPDGKHAPPKEFRIFRAGINEAKKGIWKFTAASAQRVMDKAHAYGNDLSIDYGHGMFAFISADPAETGKAAGWFTPEVRDGELWASQVQWTPKAAAMLADREYRYISPSFDISEDGEIQAVHNLALTNIPAMHALEPLVASQAGAGNPDEEEEETPMKSLLVLMGLADTATEAEAMGALQRMQAPVTELQSLTGKAIAGDALAVVKAWKVAADSVPALHSELTQVKASQDKAARDAIIAEGKRSGRVPPAYEPVLATMELSQLEAFMKVAVPVLPVPNTETGGGAAASSTVDASVAKTIGVSAEEIAKRRQARLGTVPVGNTTASK